MIPRREVYTKFLLGFFFRLHFFSGHPYNTVCIKNLHTPFIALAEHYTVIIAAYKGVNNTSTNRHIDVFVTE